MTYNVWVIVEEADEEKDHYLDIHMEKIGMWKSMDDAIGQFKTVRDYGDSLQVRDEDGFSM